MNDVLRYTQNVFLHCITTVKVYSTSFHLLDCLYKIHEKHTVKNCMYVQTVFLMMNIWCSKHLEDAKSWIKILIWKACICWLSQIIVAQCTVQKNKKLYYSKLLIINWTCLSETSTSAASVRRWLNFRGVKVSFNLPTHCTTFMALHFDAVLWL